MSFGKGINYWVIKTRDFDFDKRIFILLEKWNSLPQLVVQEKCAMMAMYTRVRRKVKVQKGGSAVNEKESRADPYLLQILMSQTSM